MIYVAWLLEQKLIYLNQLRKKKPRRWYLLSDYRLENGWEMTESRISFFYISYSQFHLVWKMKYHNVSCSTTVFFSKTFKMNRRNEKWHKMNMFMLFLRLFLLCLLFFLFFNFCQVSVNFIWIYHLWNKKKT